MTAQAESQVMLPQRRARHAWKAVERIKEENWKDHYGREAKKLPVRIMASGLGQALAFLCARAERDEGGSGRGPAFHQLHQDLSDWILNHRKLARGNSQNLLQSIVFGDSVFVRQATDEVLAYLEWLNRFLEAEGIGKGEE